MNKESKEQSGEQENVSNRLNKERPVISNRQSVELTKYRKNKMSNGQRAKDEKESN